MNPSRGLDAFALPIYEPIYLINTYGQSLWKALFSPHEARYCVQYEAHYWLGSIEFVPRGNKTTHEKTNHIKRGAIGSNSDSGLLWRHCNPESSLVNRTAN